MFCEIVSSLFPELFKQNQLSTCQRSDLVTPALWVRLNNIPTFKISRVFETPRRSWEAALITYRLPSKETHVVVPGIGLGAFVNSFSFNPPSNPTMSN